MRCKVLGSGPAMLHLAQITGDFPVSPLVPGGFPETFEITQIHITEFTTLLSLSPGVQTLGKSQNPTG